MNSRDSRGRFLPGNIPLNGRDPVSGRFIEKAAAVAPAAGADINSLVDQLFKRKGVY